MILPAFGVTIDGFEALRAIGCVLVDTTCGSVLNVWKRVESYARDGFTALIHGKYYHEETRATASQVLKYPSGALPLVRDMDEAREVCDYIEGRGDRATRSSRKFAQGGVAGLRSGRAPAPHRRGEPDDDARAASRSRSARKSGRRSSARAARRRAPRTSAPSTRSAARRRSGRTR